MPHVASCVGILSHTDWDTTRATGRTWRRKSFKKLMPRTFQFVAPAFLPLKQLRGKCRWRWARKDTLDGKELLFCFSFTAQAVTMLSQQLHLQGILTFHFICRCRPDSITSRLGYISGIYVKGFVRLYVRLCDHVCLSVCLSVYALVCLSLGFQISGYLSRATVALTVLKSLKHATVQARSAHSNRQPKNNFYCNEANNSPHLLSSRLIFSSHRFYCCNKMF